MKSTRGITTATRRFPAILRNALCVAVVLTLALAPTALATSIPTTMRVAMISDPGVQLYPLRVMDRDVLSMLDLVYETLVVLNDDREPVPSLATSWELLSDGKNMVFHIREGVYFHDGRELTAYDVQATMDLIKEIVADESLAASEKGMYSLLPSYYRTAEATDDRTLRVRTDTPFNLLYAMTFPVLQAQSVRDVNPPGTGPYRVLYYEQGKELALVGNENWWAQPPYVSEIDGIWYDSPENAVSAFESEDVDIVITRSSVAVRYRGTGVSRANTYTYSTRQLEVLVMHNGYSPLRQEIEDTRTGEKLTMRHAIAFAIDKNRLISTVYQNMVTVTDTIQSPASWLYNDTNDVKRYPYNPEEAKRLLDALGWNLIDDEGYRYKKSESGGDTQLLLRLAYYDEAGNALRKEAANEIAAMLRAVGIRIKLESYSFDKVYGKLDNGDYHLFLCAYNFDIVPDPGFLLLSSAAHEGNFAHYRSDEANAAIQALRKATTRDSYLQNWLDLQAQVAADVPILPLYWRNGIVLTRYAYSQVRDIREFEQLRSIEKYR